MDTTAQVIQIAVGLIAFLALCVGVQALVRARRKARRQMPTATVIPLKPQWEYSDREQRTTGPRYVCGVCERGATRDNHASCTYCGANVWLAITDRGPRRSA